MKKNFINTFDFSQKEINSLINRAITMKKGKVTKTLSGKVLGMLFFNPSLRSRLSSTVAMQKLGGLAVDLSVGEGKAYPFEFKDGVVMDKDTIEHVKDAARVISRYCDGLAIRASKLVTTGSKSVEVSSWEELKQDEILSSFCKYATVPVINMESNVYHPCQGLGDAMTIVEKFKSPKKKKYVLLWAYHPKALPMATPNSQFMAACDLGMDVTVAYPAGWELDDQIINVAKKHAKEAGGSLTISNNQVEALAGADIVCAKSWGALKYYGDWAKEKRIREKLKNWIINDDALKLTNNGYFMHCLPVRRNVEVADSVIDGDRSLVIDEAENRMWVQMAIFEKLLG